MPYFPTAPAIDELAEEIHAIARSKGFWDGERNPAEVIALIHSEASEALEVLSDTAGTDEQLTEELADIIIRVLDFAGARRLHIGQAVRDKIEINRKRPHMHGRNF